MVNAPLESLPRCRFFTCALPSDDDGCAFKRQQDLWGASHLYFGGDGAAQFLGIPTGGCTGVGADEVDVIEKNCALGHWVAPM